MGVRTAWQEASEGLSHGVAHTLKQYSSYKEKELQSVQLNETENHQGGWMSRWLGSPGPLAPQLLQPQLLTNHTDLPTSHLSCQASTSLICVPNTWYTNGTMFKSKEKLGIKCLKPILFGNSWHETNNTSSTGLGYYFSDFSNLFIKPVFYRKKKGGLESWLSG